MRFFNLFLAYMVEKYQNEILPIFHYGKSLKTNKNKKAGEQSPLQLVQAVRVGHDGDDEPHSPVDADE